MSIPASIIYYYCKIWRAGDGFLSLYLKSCCSLSRPFPSFLLLEAVACCGCMTSPTICIFSRHVWACLPLFDSAILNCAIVVYLFIEFCIDKASERLFSTNLKTSVFYTTALRAYCLRIKLLVVFCPVSRSSELNFINIKCPCLLQRFYCDNYC
jgi:hypothetical protein